MRRGLKVHKGLKELKVLKARMEQQELRVRQDWIQVSQEDKELREFKVYKVISVLRVV